MAGAAASDTDDQPITRLLAELAEGADGAEDRLAEAVVERLEQIADRAMARSNRGSLDGLTLEPRVLAHDALLKLLEATHAFENRRHLFAYAGRIIDRAMLDYLRRRRAQRRGGDLVRVTLSGLGSRETIDVERMPPALAELAELAPRPAEVVRLRVYWGATTDQIAEILGVSASSVERDWRFARRWLASRLRPADPADGAPDGSAAPR
ncbi:MAG: ECF-type sigma factor [Acidobacteriota bacterium]